ncbi:START domain-containing protein [Chitinophaga sp. CC14]|uniref:START domain-containing protein n=1 Tax=Chitinophaga sp. CC14 TaxID=3029199 RepID=UPI003B799597
MQHLSVLVISSMMFVRSLFVDTSEFKLVKQDNAIALYERWIPGAGGENVREIKAIFQVKCAIPAVIGLFKDQARGREWNTNASDYRIATAPDPHHWITYIKYDIPWPVDDQDCCLLYRYQEMTGDAAEVAFESITDHRFPLYNKTTRITGTRGKWIMAPLENGQLQITYMVTTDRSKKIPRWVSDPIIHDNLFRTMTKFKSLLENKTYARQ